MNLKQSNGWQSVRSQIIDWPKPALIALVKDLYNASSDNRDFLHARFQAEEAAGPALEKYRRKIAEQFFPSRGFGKLRLNEARKAIRDYRNATGNLTGTIDLMLSYVENGTEFTNQFGDINESFYCSLESVLSEMTQLLLAEGSDVYVKFRDRILRLDDYSGKIGWGYGDALGENVFQLESQLASPLGPAESKAKNLDGPLEG